MTKENKVESIGQRIGIVKHSFTVRQDENSKEKVKINYNIDFTTATDDQIRGWLAADRTIAFQRPLRSLSLDEIKGMEGTTIIAQYASRKQPSREEQIQALVAAGLPRKIAEFSIDNPDAFKEAMGGIDTGK